MTTETIVVIVLAFVQIPIGILGATMPETRSRIPPIIASISTCLMLISLWIYFRDSISAEQVLFSSIALSVISLIVTCFYIFIHKPKPQVNQPVVTIGMHHKDTIEYRKEYLNKRIIPDKLLELDNYLNQGIIQQNMTFERLKMIGPNLFKWYDWIRLIAITIIYTNKHLTKIFKTSLINYILRFSTKFNLALSEVGLGTIPIVEKDNNYKKLYQDIVDLESGLPIHITTKIHRNITLSMQFNSLRILNPNSSFWEEIEKRNVFGSKTTLIKNSFTMLIMPVDNSLTALRGEVSSDIENYFNANN
jgi:hypothetical protein